MIKETLTSFMEIFLKIYKHIERYINTDEEKTASLILYISKSVKIYME